MKLIHIKLTILIEKNHNFQNSQIFVLNCSFYFTNFRTPKGICLIICIPGESSFIPCRGRPLVDANPQNAEPAPRMPTASPGIDISNPRPPVCRSRPSLSSSPKLRNGSFRQPLIPAGCRSIRQDAVQGVPDPGHRPKRVGASSNGVVQYGGRHRPPGHRSQGRRRGGYRRTVAEDHLRPS